MRAKTGRKSARIFSRQERKLHSCTVVSQGNHPWVEGNLWAKTAQGENVVNALASGKSPAAKKDLSHALTSGPPQTGGRRSRGATQRGPERTGREVAAAGGRSGGRATREDRAGFGCPASSRTWSRSSGASLPAGRSTVAVWASRLTTSSSSSRAAHRPGNSGWCADIGRWSSRRGGRLGWPPPDPRVRGERPRPARRRIGRR